MEMAAEMVPVRAKEVVQAPAVTMVLKKVQVSQTMTMMMRETLLRGKIRMKGKEFHLQADKSVLKNQTVALAMFQQTPAPPTPHPLTL